MASVTVKDVQLPKEGGLPLIPSSPGKSQMIPDALPSILPFLENKPQHLNSVKP